MDDFDLKITPRSLPQEVAEKLKSAILSGRFGPGDRLVEADLCERLNVSRTSIREAFRILQTERLIEIFPNRGPQVAVLTLDEARQIYEVRALLEGRAAALCAQHATPADHSQMAVALEDFRRAVEEDDAAERLAATGRFYDLLLDRSENAVIRELVTTLNARINFLRLRSMSQKGRAVQSLEEMTKIFEAIRAGDPDAAAEAARSHVQNARAVIEMQDCAPNSPA